MSVQADTMVERTSLAELAANLQLSQVGTDATVVRRAVDAGERLDIDTQPNERTALLVSSGRIEVTLDGERHTLEAGDVIRFDDAHDISPVALEHSEILLVATEQCDR